MSEALNSEAIFEVIGNYPVTDQFDVLYTNLQSGSYTDNYVTGSLLTKDRNKQLSSSIGGRGLAFSKLGVDRATVPNGSSTNDDRSRDDRSYTLQPWCQRAGVLRIAKHFSDVERYYDSLTPSFAEMLSVHGHQINYSGGPFQVATVNVVPLGKPDFLMSYPFESIYSSVKRLLRSPQGFLANFGSGPPKLVTNLVIESSDRLCADNVGPPWRPKESIVLANKIYRAEKLNSIGEAFVGLGPRESDFNKIIYGYGDWTAHPSGGVYGGFNHWPVFRSGSQQYQLNEDGDSVPAFGPNSFLVGPQIRGWKYGLFDANPHYTSCVFRRDRYGQFRDMLEQRLQPASYNDYDNSPNVYFGSFESAPLPPPPVMSPGFGFEVTPGTIDQPLVVKFVKQKITAVPTETGTLAVKLDYVEQPDRNYTWSSNLSTYATSSLPFFDIPGPVFDKNRKDVALGTNRSAIPDGVSKPEEIVI